jgi:hypothetical protein
VTYVIVVIYAISGPMNLTGDWGGTMGSVVTRKYDLSMSPWVRNVDRNSLLTFAPCVPTRTVLVVTPKNPETDFGLFVRPFTNESWEDATSRRSKTQN